LQLETLVLQELQQLVLQELQQQEPPLEQRK
jgi:hypothetical protein